MCAAENNANQAIIALEQAIKERLPDLRFKIACVQRWSGEAMSDPHYYVACESYRAMTEVAPQIGDLLEEFKQNTGFECTVFGSIVAL